MRRVDAHRHAGQSFHDWNVRKVDEVPVRISHVGLHSAQTEHHLAVALGSEILGRVERLIEGDTKTALDEYREVLLSSDVLQQLEVLGVPRADLQHHAGWTARGLQRSAYLIDVRLVGDFHGDDTNAVFSGQLEHIRQALRAEALERVG